MVTLYNKIEELCKSKKINVTQMCKDIGVSRASLSDLKAGRTTHLSAKTIELISNYFGVSADYLLGTDSSEIKKRPPLPKRMNAILPGGWKKPWTYWSLPTH